MPSPTEEGPYPVPLPDRVSPADLPEHDPVAAEIVITQATTTIEADDEEDPGYQTEGNKQECSITPSVRDYNFEYGRRYHKYKEGYYVFPNDVWEQDREDLKHAMIVNLCGGKLHFAPIGDHPQNIIDLGTGTGIWCMDSQYRGIGFCIGMLIVISGRRVPLCTNLGDRSKSHSTRLGASKRQVHGRRRYF